MTEVTVKTRPRRLCRVRTQPPWLCRTPVALAAVLIAVAVCGCGGSSSKAASKAESATAVQMECTNIADVLSDGPDPNADPVGYAEAQILPLRELHIADGALRQVVSKLADDYAAYSSSNGLAAAQAVSRQEGVLLAMCPKGEGNQILPGQVLP